MTLSGALLVVGEQAGVFLDTAKLTRGEKCLGSVALIHVLVVGASFHLSLAIVEGRAAEVRAARA